MSNFYLSAKTENDKKAIAYMLLTEMNVYRRMERPDLLKETELDFLQLAGKNFLIPYTLEESRERELILILEAARTLEVNTSFIECALDDQLDALEFSEESKEG